MDESRFLTLDTGILRPSWASRPVAAEDKTKKKFRPGGWKHGFLRRLEKHLPGRRVVGFHMAGTRNMVVWPSGGSASKGKVMFFSGPPDEGRMRSLASRHPDCRVFIDAGEDMFMSMPMKSYLKLSRVSGILAEFRLYCRCDDGETFEVHREEQLIDNINELAHYVAHHRAGVEGVYRLQMDCCGFQEYIHRFRILVLDAGGKARAYKSDMNDFLRDYGLRLL